MLIKEFWLELNEDVSIQISVEQGKYSPTIIWESKEDWLNFVEESKKVWNSMTEDRREGIRLIMKHAIQRLHDRIDIWLPEAIDASSGTYLDVHFKIMLTDADVEIQKHSAMTGMRLAEAEADIKELLAKVHKND